MSYFNVLLISISPYNKLHSHKNVKYKKNKIEIELNKQFSTEYKWFDTNM